MCLGGGLAADQGQEEALEGGRVAGARDQAAGAALANQVGPIGLALTYGTAVLLVIMAFGLVRLLPKKEVSR